MGNAVERARKVMEVVRLLESIGASDDIDQGLRDLDVEKLAEGVALTLEIHEESENYEACAAIRDRIAKLLAYREKLLARDAGHEKTT